MQVLSKNLLRGVLCATFTYCELIFWDFIGTYKYDLELVVHLFFILDFYIATKAHTQG